MVSGHEWSCPKCHRINAAKAKLCTKCGYDPALEKQGTNERPKVGAKAVEEERKEPEREVQEEEQQVAREIPPFLESSIILESDEKIVNSWWGNHEVTARAIAKGSFGQTKVVAAKQRKNGALILTNQRLLFLEEHGVFGKSYHQVLSVPLVNVSGVSMGGSVFPFVSISDNTRVHIFHLQEISQVNFEQFRQVISKQCINRKTEIEAEKRKERVHVVLDFSALKDYMEKGGLILQKMKCPECGAPLTLPTVGSQTKCEHCGSTIYAQNIFEKIKSLIG